MALFDILKRKKKKEKIDTGKSVKEKPIAEKTTHKEEKKSKLEEKQTSKPKNVKKTKAPKTPPVRSVKKDSKDTVEQLSHVIIRPRITEKASTQSGGNSYTFEVERSTNKIQIKKAIKEVYNVEPTKVNIISMKSKKKMVRNVLGKTSSFKKAVVFLKDGDTIEFV